MKLVSSKQLYGGSYPIPTTRIRPYGYEYLFDDELVLIVEGDGDRAPSRYVLDHDRKEVEVSDLSERLKLAGWG